MRVLHLLCIFSWMAMMIAPAQTQHQRENQRPRSSPSESGQGKYRKGSYLGLTVSGGASTLDYKLRSLSEEGKRKGSFGYGVNVNYSYFFNTHWGIVTGVSASQYTAKGKLMGDLTDENYHALGNLIDNDFEGRPRSFELRARLKNLEEKQTAWLVDVPIMLAYQTYFGDEKKWGIYGDLGIKFQLPVLTKFRIENGSAAELNVSGYYKDIPVDMGAPSQSPVIQHGYGTINDPNSLLDWDDKGKLKMGIALAMEAGLLFTIADGKDLQIGGYIDYGLNDLKKNGGQGLLTAPTVYHPAADNQIGKGIKYNGMLNSDVTDKIRMISFGGKVTLRFKL